MRFKIEQNVPIPLGGGRGGSKYPFKDLQVNESFGVPYRNGKDEVSGQKIIAAVSNATSKASKELAPKRFISRKMPEAGEVRVWRVA